MGQSQPIGLLQDFCFLVDLFNRGLFALVHIDQGQALQSGPNLQFYLYLPSTLPLLSITCYFIIHFHFSPIPFHSSNSLITHSCFHPFHLITKAFILSSSSYSSSSCSTSTSLFVIIKSFFSSTETKKKQHFHYITYHNFYIPSIQHKHGFYNCDSCNHHP